MNISCPKCGTAVDDYMTFCFKCGKPLRDTAPTAHSPRVEYKNIVLNVNKKPYTKHFRGSLEDQEKALLAAEQRVLEELQPFLAEGWQLNGTFSSAVRLIWEDGIFGADKLKEATVRLIRYN